MKYINLLTLLILTNVFCITPSEGFSRIPIRSFPVISKQKFLQIQIEEKPYLVLIDTGSYGLFMKKEIINQIKNKDHVFDSEYMNFFGNKYTTPNFKIPALQIGDFFIETLLREEDENFSADCEVKKRFSISWHLSYEGMIGMDVFKKFLCIFDFPHSSIYLANEMSSVTDTEEFLDVAWHAVPFTLGKAGAILIFETDLGKKRLLLDAGSTLSAIRLTDEEKVIHKNNGNAREFTTNMLGINDLDFGLWKFYVIDIAQEVDDIDGLLGIEFFNKNMIGLDFPNGIAYIQSPRLGSKERFTYWLKSCFGK